MAPDRLTDAFGRTLNYLRISLTTACNLRCIYCRPRWVRSLPVYQDDLSDDEIVQVTEVAGFQLTMFIPAGLMGTLALGYLARLFK